MTFPIEAEATIKRRILDVCQSQARTIVDIVRELALMVDSVAEKKGKATKTHYEGMLKLIADNDKLRTTFLGEVASVGSFLMSREDFLRLMFRMSAIADYAEALGFRLMGATERSWKLDTKYIHGLSEILSLVLSEVTRMRETLHSLSFDSDKAVELSRLVEELERKIDIDSRNLDFEILSAKLPLQEVLLLRDMVERAEMIADIGVEVVDLIRVLALTA
ncbi:hypothetical protein MUP07_09690 [Candidatus Bathyarchaeota archaeon]|nr:hypothetical protein [Candidatus Bathyarchaeota archaeon]